MRKFLISSAMLSNTKSIRRLALLLAVIATSCVGAATAQAQQNRTWVSSTGNDTGNTQCSRTAPCLTFAHAIAETASYGEINCVDAGGFGTVSISISVTINCEGASNGGITVGSLGTGISIGASGIVVNLIGLDIDGENGAGSYGVQITAAATVNVRNCKIYGFSQDGLQIAPETSGGILVVDNTFIANNAQNGIAEYTDFGVVNMTVRNSNINNNQNGIMLLIGGSHVGATIEQTTIAFNTNYGLVVEGSGAIALMGGSTVVNNTTGVNANSGGVVYSFKNNQIGGNDSDGTPLTAYPGGPLN
jgi:hypothetical protein